MILFILAVILLLLIFSNNNEKFSNENNLKIINEIEVKKSSCFYNNNELFLGKKYIQKLSDNKFYTTCEYNLDNKGKCSAPCLLIDEKCNTTNDPVSLSLNKNNVEKCRTKSKPL
jgi:hypothetical protein